MQERKEPLFRIQRVYGEQGQRGLSSEDLTRDVTETGEGNVDEEVAAATPLHEDTQRREDDGEEELEDVRAGKSHDCCCFLREEKERERGVV